MPGDSNITVQEDRARLRAELVEFSKDFAIACTPPSDIIPLLARGEREQAAVATAAVQKAATLSARRPLPRLSTHTTFASNSSASSPRTAPIIVVNAVKMANLTAPNFSEPAGNKSFAMQNREVDAVKAVVPLPSTEQPSAFTKAESIRGHPNDDSVRKPTSSDIPQKAAKKKSFKPSKQRLQDDLAHATAQPAYAEASTHWTVHGGADEFMGGNAQLQEHKDMQGWGNDENKNRGPGTGQMPFNNKGYGKYKSRGGGLKRNNRSNTINEQGPQRGQRYQPDNTDFRSLRGNPHRSYPENHGPAVLGKEFFSGGSVTYDGPYEQPHQYDVPADDPLGVRSPSGSWYPRHQNQSKLALHMQAQGLPPAFVPSSAMMLPPPPPPPSAKQPTVSLPFAQSSKSLVLPQSAMSTTSSTTLTTTNNTPSMSASETVVAASSDDGSFDGVKKSDKPTALIASNVPFHDPRPANMRIESLMTTIACELEQLKRRVLPGTEHKISPLEIARYLDSCMNLCKHVTTASAELTEENKSLGRALAATDTHGVGEETDRTTHHVSTGLKIGGVAHSRAQSLDRSMTGSKSMPQQKYRLPSGATTEFPPLIPTYEGYRTETMPKVATRPIESQKMQSAIKGAWWHQTRPEFTNSEADLTEVSTAMPADTLSE